MNCYKISRIMGLPDWHAIPALEAANILWLPDAGIRMTQQICYNNEALFIHQSAVEGNIRALHNDPLASVCEDSCMEFFFCPEQDSDRYFNFEWNLNGCLYLGFHDGEKTAVRLLPQNAIEQFSFCGRSTETGWEIFYRIPLGFIQMFCPDFSFAPGVTIRANCYKCGDKTEKPHYLSWNPCTCEYPNFHRPSDFGCMVFGD